jgi:glycosyltransferase involved in cell wall biosynthesis
MGITIKNKNDIFKAKLTSENGVMPNMKVTIIIPVLNQEELVIRALDSIRDGFDIEIIVIDDGSTDNTFNNVLQYKNDHPGKNIVLLYNEENKGVSYTINRGLDCASGDYIGLLGSDDYYYTEELEKVFKQLDGTGVVYFNLRTNDGTIFNVTEETKYGYCGSVKFIRKDLINDIRNDENLKYGEDYFFFQELMKKKPTEKFTGIVAKHYNFPREGSLHQQQIADSKKR